MHRAVLVLVLLCPPAGALAAQDSVAPAPPAVTPALVDEGGKLFKGQGLCAACHGVDGRGGVGPSLADTVWLSGRGTLEEIVTRIIAGVPAEDAVTGVPMPPRGGSRITDDQARAVAAYVWSLSRPRSP